MITLSKLRRKPRHFRAFTGLTPFEFDALLVELTPVYKATLTQRSRTSDRLRDAGAGHPFSLELPDRLLMGLIYLRLSVSQTLLAYLFDLDESNISRELRLRLLPALQSVLPTPLQDAPLRSLCAETDRSSDASLPLAPTRKKRITTLQELLLTYPEIAEVLLDATEQSAP